MSSHLKPLPGMASFDSVNKQSAFTFRPPNCSALGKFGRCRGTREAPFNAYIERAIAAEDLTNHYQTISSMAPHRDFSFEELRLADYDEIRRPTTAKSLFPAQSFANPPHLQLPHERVPAALPHTAPPVPPGFEEAVPKPKPMETAIRVALIEQELRLCQAQLTEATRINTELTGHHRTEITRVATLVQELAHCERRSAKAEIAVEHLSELHVQMLAKVKQHAEPDRRILTLEKQFQNVNHDAELRISVLELEVQSLSQDNEKLKSKLENAMDTVLALCALQGSVRTTKNPKINGSRAAGAKSQSKCLIDLVDDCFAPKENCMNEEQTTTLLNASNDPEDDHENIDPTIEPSRTLSDSSHSDFSNSSYIVRFKGVRDMRKHGSIVDTPTMPVTDEARASGCTREERSKIPPSSVRPTESDKMTESSSNQATEVRAPLSISASTNRVLEHQSTADLGGFKETSYMKCAVPPAQPLALRQNKTSGNWVEPRKTPALDVAASIYPAPSIFKGLTENANSGQATSFTNNGTSRATPSLKKAEVLPMIKSEHEKSTSIDAENAKLTSETFSVRSLRFYPDFGETNVHRTIVMSNLPPDVTLSELLDRVRGGLVFAAHLLDTVSITGNYSAMITFLDGHAAVAYEKYAKLHPIIFHGLPAKVSISTPTWPISSERRNCIIDRQQTRCLEIPNFPSNFSPTILQSDLKTCSSMSANWVVYKCLTKRGLLKIHFSSIEHAFRAYNVLMKRLRYENCTIYFVPDPCARPLATLENPHGNKSMPKAPVQAYSAAMLTNSSLNADPAEPFKHCPPGPHEMLS